jgi:hypothetical protein
METGHFTQMVWKNSKRIGCAWNTNTCKSNGMNFYKLVCEYDPPGNIVGGNYFKDNVPKPVKKTEAELEGELDLNSFQEEEINPFEPSVQMIIQIN